MTTMTEQTVPAEQTRPSRPNTKLLLIVIVILLGQVIWQASRIQTLKADVGYQQRHMEEQAGQLATERLRGRREDVVRASQWLHEFYKSADGLQRPDGLWLPGPKQPDFEALGAWIFDVYLNERIKGTPEDDARRVVADAIKGSDELRQLHPKQ